MMWMIRGILWAALVSTAAFFGLLMYVFPPEGDVAQFIVIVVGVVLAVAWISLQSWADTEEALEHSRERWAYKDRVEAEWAGLDQDTHVLLKRLAESRWS